MVSPRHSDDITRAHGLYRGSSIGAATASSVVSDFALVVQRIPPTTELSWSRALRKSPCKSNPAVLLGFRARTMDGDGSVVTLHDKDVLLGLMEPYLSTLTEHLGILRRRAGRRYHPPTWAILFCTYLKAGYLHIVAFPPATRAQAAILVDSIAIRPRNNSEEDCRSRLRLATALFTLQRHVVMFAAHWDENVWPRAILEEEYGNLVERLGPSEPSSMSDDGEWWDCEPEPSELPDPDNDKNSDLDGQGDNTDGDSSDEGGSDSDSDSDAHSHSHGDNSDDNVPSTRLAESVQDHWKRLEQLCNYHQLPERISNMRRVEAWVEAYDLRNLRVKGRPIP